MNISKLKGLMAEHGDTQEDIAKLLNIHVTSLYHKMKGKTEFKFSEVQIIASHYNVDINIFLK
ncbi:MAG: helix-turn-helix domain-containing protein [Prevotella sp.]|nr:helix-turn-helix domain-containing protein [Staphylococcus sp.]MCM1349918.1 helix-turn-helix domain-containing protein [Prevotella sp.]